MSRRASWRGQLTFSDLSCEVGLYAAVSSNERISFNIVNRKTGNRVERQLVDSDTGAVVEHNDQVKGYALDNGDHLIVEGDEIAALMPENDKVMAIGDFVNDDGMDLLYLDRPYFLTGYAPQDEEALAVLSRLLHENKVMALANAILFRRNRLVLVRSDGKTLIAHTLHFNGEVRSEKTVFKAIPDMEFDDEMLELAEHIIQKKSGRFDPADYSDRYNDALAELVKAKSEGRQIKKPARKKEDNVVSLRDALRESAGVTTGKKSKRKPAAAARTRKAS